MKTLLNSGLARVISFILAIALSAIIFIYPQSFVSNNTVDHGLYSLLFVAISVGFIHGVGFSPRNIILWVILGPLFAWPILLWGLTRFSVLISG